LERIHRHEGGDGPAMPRDNGGFALLGSIEELRKLVASLFGALANTVFFHE
jgi:hypothetical protein